MKITVIMPSLNVAPYIEKCIQSVVNQTLQDIEILCIDAGSTDGTLEILEQFKREDSRIRIIYSDKKSYGYQVNMGIDMAKGKYIGIVETDDFIASDMYEKLYDIAESHNLDYAKGTYDNFISLDENHVSSWGIQPLGNYSQYRDRVIEACNIPQIYAYDANIWSGIYNRNFLLKKYIRLNESPGAAYQDIGFLQQTIGYAQRAWYSSQSFYRYRIDRDESSVKSPKGLNFSKGEFERLVSDKRLFDGIACKQGLYSRMLLSFLAELKRILPLVSYDMSSEYVKDSFLWFKNSLKGHYQGSICTADKEEFEAVLRDENGYVQSLKRKNIDKQNRRDKICQDIELMPVVIFGAGIRGGSALCFLLSNQKNVVAFCDNDKEKQTDPDVCMPVLSIDICMKKYPGAVYVIANKYHAGDIQLQLLDMGVEASRIMVFDR